MGHIQDRWYRPKRDERTGELVTNSRGKLVMERTELYSIGLRYKVRYLDPSNRERSKSFPDRQRKRAEDFLVEVESDKREGKYIDPNAGRVKFEDVARRWLDSQTVDHTSRERFETRVKVHLLPRFGGDPIGSIKPSDVQRWLRGLQDADIAVNSQALYFGHLVSIFNFAVADKLILENPAAARSVKRPRASTIEVKPWPLERAKAMRDALPTRFKVAVDIPASIGIRKGELFGISLDDFDRDREIVKVQRQVRIVQGCAVFALPKGGKTREVPVSPALLERLDLYADHDPAVDVSLPWKHPEGRRVTVPLLMTTPDGSALTPKVMDKIWIPALKAAGVETRTRADGIHALRHLYASVLLDAGESVKALSMYLGHSDPGFTLRVYAHLMPTSHTRTQKAVENMLATALTAEPDLPEEA
ncbi:tyrosine-type recombinase/integrase [Phytoactinopolyspora endophytica]|uniref:tyrosine-type recombinase/integrase n=1 Tax=Phytoactinopolyspora endophytica TaxID=1642495 RepID=UPI00101B8A0F|nr:site-specific integrase [Phytoactinopolyspora endophytica]